MSNTVTKIVNSRKEQFTAYLVGLNKEQRADVYRKFLDYFYEGDDVLHVPPCTVGMPVDEMVDIIFGADPVFTEDGVMDFILEVMGE